MRFLDLHCDTVTECLAQGFSLSDNPLHLDVRRASCFDTWIQTFAIWIPDTLRGKDAWAYFERNYDFYLQQTDLCGLTRCVRYADMERVVSEGGFASILAVEGGAVLGGMLERTDELYRRGVRILTLTWNAENELGFGCQSEGGHLKPFGRDVLRRMDALGMIADVSHLDRIGFYDVLEQTARHVLASHSTSEAVLRSTRRESVDSRFSKRRALSDDQIRALSAHGGLIGLNFCGSFLGDPGDDGIQAAIRHAAHILELGGEDILAIGSDFDGCPMHADLSGIEKIPALYEAFLQSGFGSALCEKLFFRNGLHFFKNML
ncbi:MAG: membrane dipeptidase [Clostridia bacterium]|nr:membrane dipeptidase [Clostridia bacterium]